MNGVLSAACCVILAAGEGKRMNSDVPKVLSEVLFKPMLGWIIDSVFKSNISDICVVKGFRHEMVQSYLESLSMRCESVIQKERKGTAHAVMTAKAFLEKHKGGDVLILGGDSPFIDKETILGSYQKHKDENNSATIVSAKVENPFGYGRIIRDSGSGPVIDIVEERDATAAQKATKEINSGVYWFKVNDILSKLFEINNNTAQNEYYLTSIIKLFIEEGYRVNAFDAKSPEVVLGANDLKQLEMLNLIARNNVLDKLVENGVDIPCRDGVIIGCDTTIQKKVRIFPNTVVLGKSVILEGATLGPNSQILDSEIGENVIFNSSYCKNSIISAGKFISPFTYLSGEKL